jgi:hypothetical protein
MPPAAQVSAGGNFDMKQPHLPPWQIQLASNGNSEMPPPPNKSPERALPYYGADFGQVVNGQAVGMTNAVSGFVGPRDETPRKGIEQTPFVGPPAEALRTGIEQVPLARPPAEIPRKQIEQVSISGPPADVSRKGVENLDIERRKDHLQERAVINKGKAPLADAALRQKLAAALANASPLPLPPIGSRELPIGFTPGSVNAGPPGQDGCKSFALDHVDAVDLDDRPRLPTAKDADFGIADAQLAPLLDAAHQQKLALQNELAECRSELKECHHLVTELSFQRSLCTCGAKRGDNQAIRELQELTREQNFAEQRLQGEVGELTLTARLVAERHDAEIAQLRTALAALQAERETKGTDVSTGMSEARPRAFDVGTLMSQVGFGAVDMGTGMSEARPRGCDVGTGMVFDVGTGMSQGRPRGPSEWSQRSRVLTTTEAPAQDMSEARPRGLTTTEAPAQDMSEARPRELSMTEAPAQNMSEAPTTGDEGRERVATGGSMSSQCRRNRGRKPPMPWIRKIDPEDYWPINFDELNQRYGQMFDLDEIWDYWDEQMTSIGGPAAENAAEAGKEREHKLGIKETTWQRNKTMAHEPEGWMLHVKQIAEEYGDQDDDSNIAAASSRRISGATGCSGATAATDPKNQTLLSTGQRTPLRLITPHFDEHPGHDTPHFDKPADGLQILIPEQNTEEAPRPEETVWSEEQDARPVTPNPHEQGASATRDVTPNPHEQRASATRDIGAPNTICMDDTAATYDTLSPTGTTDATATMRDARVSSGNASRKLQVTIIEASGLDHLNFTGDNMYCVASVKHTDKKAKATSCQTAKIQSLNPTWNETHELGPWSEGDALEFTVYDKGMIGSKTEGTAILTSERFFPNGFDGQLPISGHPHAALHVKVDTASLLPPATGS